MQILSDQIKTIHITPAPASLAVFLTSRMKILQSKGFEPIGFSSHDQNADTFQAAGFKFITSRYLTRTYNALKDIRFFMECYQVFKQEQPIIVNTYGPKPGLYARIAARVAGVPIVIHTSWGLFFPDDAPWYRKMPVIMLDKFAALFCDYVFSVNYDDLHLMQRYNFRPKSHLGYLGNGTDIAAKFNPNNYHAEIIEKQKIELGLKPNQLVIGMVGRLTKSKGFKEYFAAAQTLQAKYPNINFVIVGSTDFTKGDGITEGELTTLEEQGIVKYLGAKKHDEMPLMYAIMDIVVLLSYREGFPRSLVEAVSMGKPVVATNIRGCREAVEHGVNGYLVPLKDHQACASALEQLIINKEKINRFAKASREKAEKEFDENNLVNNISNVYNGLIADYNKNSNELISIGKRSADSL